MTSDDQIRCLYRIARAGRDVVDAGIRCGASSALRWARAVVASGHGLDVIREDAIQESCPDLPLD